MKTTEIPQDGRIVEALTGLQFKVELKDGKIVRAHLSGKMKVNYIRVLPGDRVAVIVSGELGRIVRRF